LAYSSVAGTESGVVDHVVRLWDVEGQVLVKEWALNHRCRGLAFSGDGQILATSSAGDEGRIALWQVPDGELLASWPAPQDVAGNGTAFAITPDLNLAVHRGQGGKSIHVLCPRTGELRWRYVTGGDRFVTFALSADGRRLAASSGNVETFIRLWDAASGREVARLEGHRAYVIGLEFSPDGKMLTSAGADQTIRLWDVETGQCRATLRGHRNEVWRLAMLPDDKTLVSGGKDGSVCLWQTATAHTVAGAVRLPQEGINQWWFDGDGGGAMTLTPEGNVVQWREPDFQEPISSIDLGRALVAFQPRNRQGNELRWSSARSSDGHWLAVGSTNGVVDVWDLRQGRRSRQRKLSSGAVGVLGFLDGGRSLLLFRHEDLSLHEWNLGLEAKNRLYDCRLPADLTAWAIAPDGSRGLALGFDGKGVLLSQRNHRIREIELDVRQVEDAAFSPDGRRFAVASSMGIVKLWDAATVQEIAALGGFVLGVHSVTFSPDGRRLAAASGGQQSIKLWDVESQQELLTLESQANIFRPTAFSPDGDVLGSMATVGGLLHLWRAPSWAEIEASELRARRSVPRQP
jgi:WD40 repeat protein